MWACAMACPQGSGLHANDSWPRSAWSMDSPRVVPLPEVSVPLVARREEKEAVDGEVSQSGDAQTSEADRLGQAPADNRRVFLRQSAVLLAPGTIEVECGFRYTLQNTDFLTVLSDGGLGQEFVDTRIFLGTLSIRYGLGERVQPYVTLPVGGAHFSRRDLEDDDMSLRFGPGDVLAGFNYLIRDGEDRCARYRVGIGSDAPTGRSTWASLTPDFCTAGQRFCRIERGTDVHSKPGSGRGVLVGGVRTSICTFVRGSPCATGRAIHLRFWDGTCGERRGDVELPVSIDCTV